MSDLTSSDRASTESNDPAASGVAETAPKSFPANLKSSETTPEEVVSFITGVKRVDSPAA